jgi:hypothetical protein
MFKGRIRRSMEVCVDDILMKSWKSNNHINELVEIFSILQRCGMKLNPLKCTYGVASKKFLGFMLNSLGIEVNPNSGNQRHPGTNDNQAGTEPRWEDHCFKLIHLQGHR